MSNVHSGYDIFRLMDSSGLPLHLIRELLAEREQAFDVYGFIEAAKASKNYENRDRLRNMLVEDVKDQRAIDLIDFSIQCVYGALSEPSEIEVATSAMEYAPGVVATFANPEVCA